MEYPIPSWEQANCPHCRKERLEWEDAAKEAWRTGEDFSTPPPDCLHCAGSGNFPAFVSEAVWLQERPTRRF